MTFLSELFVFDRKGSFCDKSDEDIFLENEIKTSMVDIAFQSQELIHNFFGAVWIVAKNQNSRYFWYIIQIVAPEILVKYSISWKVPK